MHPNGGARKVPCMPVSSMRERNQAARLALIEDEAQRGWLEAWTRRALIVGETGPLTMEAPRLGHRTLIVLVRPPADRGVPGVVIKLFESLSDLLKNRQVMKTLTRMQLPVPRYLGSSLRARWERPRRWALAEELIEGKPLPLMTREERSAAAPALARTMAAMHGHRRKRHGWLHFSRRGSAVDKAHAHFRLRLDRVAPHLADADVARIAAGAEQAADALRQRPAYELIHGHVYGNNYIVKDGRASAIDLASVHYGDAGYDLVRAGHRLCMDDDARRRFLETYFAEGCGIDREEYTRQRRFYECDYHVGRAVGAVREREKGRIDDAVFARRMQLFVERAQAAFDG